ncbi:MAG: cell division protein FtsZ [Alphaproteobacteria bacterium]|nr:cell division protein FtsZ [Alphaproteobacteria bacterium]
MSTQKAKAADPQDLRPRITVIGVGGAGSNAVNNMIRAKLEGVEFIVANTDAQALEQSLVDRVKRIQLGLNITQGLGAGSKPDVGRASAEESMEEVIDHLRGSNMVFITAGMGGGTGTGAAPVIARAARESGILTVGVVTKPFHFEGSHRARSAEKGIDELQQYVDTLIIIPNQNLFRIANERTTFADAFKMADDVLYSGVRGVTDLMMMPGLINLDFADIRAVMAEMGKAMMGTGEAEGDRRALDAAEAAISNPLLDDVSMKGAKGVLINITGGYDMTLYEVDEAANRIREDVESEANIIFGSTFDEKLNGRMRVSVVATGIGAPTAASSWRPISEVNFASSLKTTPAAAHASNAQQSPSTYSGFAASTNEDTYASLEIERTHTPAAESLNNNSDFSNSHLSNGNNDFETTEKSGNNTSFDQSENFGTPQNYQEESRSFTQQTTAPDERTERRRTPSLFERFTGVSRNRPQQHPVTEQELKHNSKNAEDDREVDILDIPAFLRRGNN